MRRAIAAAVILLAGWFGYDYYQTQQAEKAAIAAAEAAAAEAADAEAAAAAQAALDAAAAQLDPDNLIARIEASSLSVVEKNLLKAIVEAARNSPELLQGAADQVAEKIGN